MAWSKAARLAAARARKIRGPKKAQPVRRKQGNGTHVAQVVEAARNSNSLVNVNKEVALNTAKGFRKAYDSVPVGGQIGKRAKPAGKANVTADIQDNVTAAAVSKAKKKPKKVAKKVAPKRKKAK